MDIKKTLEEVGKSLPDKTRTTATQSMKINMEPQGTIKVSHDVDIFEEGKTDTAKNNLEGKEVVLFFGSEAHGLTRNLQKPKLHMMYHFMTKEEQNIEFVYVSMDKTKQEYERFTKSHPWPCIPWEEKELRDKLIAEFYTPLKKPHGACAIVIFEADTGKIVSKDSEPGLTKTHDEYGKDYPWVATTAENCCAAGTALLFCTIM